MDCDCNEMERMELELFGEWQSGQEMNVELALIAIRYWLSSDMAKLAIMTAEKLFRLLS